MIGMAVAKILVVDDATDLADVIAQLFAAMGHVTRIALDGAEAVTVALEFAPDFVLMDLDLPLLDGFDAAQAIINRLPSRPYLIAITGSNAPSSGRKSRQAGFDLVVRKPLDYTNLLMLIDAANARP
jgi:CheY-like chemotaxis protein